MIEKLDIIKDSENCVDAFGDTHNVAGHKVINKINELVDAVNSIISVQEKLIDSRFVVETKHEAPADPYAEQRKWVGKLCRCWDSDINDDIWGILQDIKDNKTEKYYLYGIGYEHCEPVKPDDDIIYKGGDNE